MKCHTVAPPQLRGRHRLISNVAQKTSRLKGFCHVLSQRGSKKDDHKGSFLLVARTRVDVTVSKISCWQGA